MLEQGMPAEAAEPHFVQIQLALRIRRRHEEFEALKREAGSSPSREQLALLDTKSKELAKLKSMRI